MLVEIEAEASAGLDHGLQVASGLVPLKSLRLSFLERLFQQSRMHTLAAGQVVFEGGNNGRCHMYVLHGEVELRSADGGTRIISGGESAFPLVKACPRACDAVARTDCSLLKIDSAQLDRILSWSQVADYLLSKLAAKPDYDEDAAWMQTLLNSNLFLKVPPINVEQIFSRLTPMLVSAGEAVIRQGELGDCCYFIKEGRARVTRYHSGGRQPQHVADIGMGRCFGEDALVHETVRNANVTMASDGVLMRLEKQDFLLLLREPEVAIANPERLEGPNAPALIDVRTSDEYAAGHRHGAANIPVHLLCLKKRLLAKDRPYIFYCDTGRRSRAAAHLLSCEGYSVAALHDDRRRSQSWSCTRDYLLRNGQVVSP